MRELWAPPPGIEFFKVIGDRTLNCGELIAVDFHAAVGIAREYRWSVPMPGMAWAKYRE